MKIFKHVYFLQGQKKKWQWLDEGLVENLDGWEHSTFNIVLHWFTYVWAGRACATLHTQRSKDNVPESVLSFRHVSSRD